MQTRLLATKPQNYTQIIRSNPTIDLRPLCSKLKEEYMAQMAKPNLATISLDEIKTRAGLMTDHVLYNTWRGINERCCSPSAKAYARYGALGICVYHPWRDKSRHAIHKRWSNGFCLFLEYVEIHLGPKQQGFSLDRIRSTGNYEPGNLRWADASLQKKNQKIKNITGYRYVYSVTGSSSWQAEYKNGTQRFYVGCFPTKEKAYAEALAHRLETFWPKDL